MVEQLKIKVMNEKELSAMLKTITIAIRKGKGSGAALNFHISHTQVIKEYFKENNLYT